MVFAQSLPSEKLQRHQLQRRVIIAISAVGLAFVLPFVCSFWLHSHPLFYAQIEHAGILLIFIAIIGRCWCALYIGGRKKTSLVEIGPYSIVRNPLYLFSMVGAAGVGAQTSSLLIATLCAVLVGFVLFKITQKEEAFLSQTHGAAFKDYCGRVPRYLPKFSGYRDVASLEIAPRLVAQTLIESSFMLIAIPAIDMVELAREMGWLPELFHLP